MLNIYNDADGIFYSAYSAVVKDKNWNSNINIPERLDGFYKVSEIPCIIFDLVTDDSKLGRKMILFCKSVSEGKKMLKGALVNGIFWIKDSNSYYIAKQQYEGSKIYEVGDDLV